MLKKKHVSMIMPNLKKNAEEVRMADCFFFFFFAFIEKKKMQNAFFGFFYN